MKKVNGSTIFILMFAAVGIAMIIGGYAKDQGGTVMVGILFAIFALACNRLTITRTDKNKKNPLC